MKPTSSSTICGDTRSTIIQPKQACQTRKKGPDFDIITVKELKQYIWERGVSVSTYKKPELILLANSLHEMNADIDPDLKIDHVLKNHLTLPAGRCVPDLFKMTNLSNDISTLPNFGLMDIFNHLIMSKTEYNKDMLASWRSFDEYTLCQNGHVCSIQNPLYLIKMIANSLGNA